MGFHIKMDLEGKVREGYRLYFVVQGRDLVWVVTNTMMSPWDTNRENFFTSS